MPPAPGQNRAMPEDPVASRRDSRTLRRVPVLFGLLAVIGSLALAAPRGKMDALRFPQADGETARPFATTNRIVAFIFVSTDCPIANRYAPEIQRLQKRFPETAFWLVYPNIRESDEAVRRHLKDYQHQAPALRDPKRELVRRASVRLTPEAALFANGDLVYHGRIDDRHVDFGKQRPEPTRRDLQDALQALREGKRPRKAGGRAVGCPIQ